MKHNVKFAFLAIVASGIIALSSCNNGQNENENYQDSVDNEEMMTPSDTGMTNDMSDTTMTDTIIDVDTTIAP